MKLKYRVQTHGFVSDDKTRLDMTGVEGTEGNFTTVLPSNEAGRYPVGTVVAFTGTVIAK